jgi:hypothetical protein
MDIQYGGSEPTKYLSKNPDPERLYNIGEEI